MKARAATMVLLGTVLPGARIVDAARERMTVEEDGITFKLDRYDDGRSKPYRVKFTDGGVSSTYKFNTEGFVKNIKAGSEKYLVQYQSNGDLKRVKRTSSRRRNLQIDDEDEEQQDETTNGNNRRLFACDDCIDVWEAVCDEGVPSVCALVGYDDPILADGEASIETLCETLGAACSRSGGVEACSGQCEEDDDGGDDDKVLNSCLDSASDDYKCVFDATSSYPNTMDFNDCYFYDADAADLPACFENFGKDNIKTLYLSFNDNLNTIPAGIFAGLSSVEDMDFSYNSLEYLPEGAFEGLSGLRTLQIHWSFLTSLPQGLFIATPNIADLDISSNRLTSLPAGLFEPLTMLERLGLWTQSGLQCVPTSTATDINLYDESSLTGTCECSPEVAITCDTGSCQPGTAGYTCE